MGKDPHFAARTQLQDLGDHSDCGLVVVTLIRRLGDAVKGLRLALRIVACQMGRGVVHRDRLLTPSALRLIAGHQQGEVDGIHGGGDEQLCAPPVHRFPRSVRIGGLLHPVPGRDSERTIVQELVADAEPEVDIIVDIVLVLRSVDELFPVFSRLAEISHDEIRRRQRAVRKLVTDTHLRLFVHGNGPLADGDGAVDLVAA